MDTGTRICFGLAVSKRELFMSETIRDEKASQHPGDWISEMLTRLGLKRLERLRKE